MRAWGKVAAIAVSVAAVAGCSMLSGGEPGATETGPTDHRVVLEVAGNNVKEADVTYVAGEDRAQERGAKLPWRKTVTMVGFEKMSVVAHNTGDAGELTCSITVDGKTKKQVTVEGEFALVACDLAAVPAGTPSAG